jgi:hypothetical protein
MKWIIIASVFFVLSAAFADAAEYGFDPGLRTHKIQSAIGHSPGLGCTDFYYDHAEGDGMPGTWFLGIQHEAKWQQSYPGCIGLSYLPNSPDSPVSVLWSGNREEGYGVHLVTDFQTFTGLRAKGRPATWVMLLNMQNMPPSPKMTVSADLSYATYLPKHTGAHAIAATWFLVENTVYEIDLCLHNVGWPRGKKKTGICMKKTLPDRKWIMLDGRHFGYSIEPGCMNQRVSIDWAPIAASVLPLSDNVQVLGIGIG